MSNNENDDIYYQIFKRSKLNHDDLKKYAICKNHTEQELDELSDLLFDLGILSQKIILETNE